MVFPDELLTEVKHEAVRQHRKLNELVPALVRLGLLAQRQTAAVGRSRESAEAWLTEWLALGNRITTNKHTSGRWWLHWRRIVEVVVDANVWLSATHAHEPDHAHSVRFLRETLTRRVAFLLPAGSSCGVRTRSMPPWQRNSMCRWSRSIASCTNGPLRKLRSSHPRPGLHVGPPDICPGVSTC